MWFLVSTWWGTLLSPRAAVGVGRTYASRLGRWSRARCGYSTASPRLSVLLEKPICPFRKHSERCAQLLQDALENRCTVQVQPHAVAVWVILALEYSIYRGCNPSLTSKLCEQQVFSVLSERWKRDNQCYKHNVFVSNYSLMSDLSD